MIPFPPAQIEVAPAARTLTFEGFNRLPLPGTVLAAEGGAFFAVLVADSGPLDRDWSEARMPVHGGRALAEWFQAQGVGSLRFDKRLAASKDPLLDTSLDAQAGDVRAALQAARALPEARGRRLLLVGHGEGALLSLLAAQGADALLLLAMPNEPMAKAIADQVGPQLPAEQAAPNLAYLQAVFQAIRTRRPTPEAGPDVHPEMKKLGIALMAPKTLDFVRATLDLDPWVLASHAPVPTAVVWGAKDLMAWKPAHLPASFKGTVLEIPEANHLFKREPRDRSELNAGNALLGYRDDLPLADLTLISNWLKTLH